MLRKLSIHNYAIIEEVSFEFNESLNIITGETGAGKSIILGALNLVLGARADTKILYDQHKKCFVQADFILENHILEKLNNNEDFDIEDRNLTIRREINSKGKSRAFINDTPVTLSTLRSTGSALIDLHQQFDTLDINDPNQQRQYLDAMAGNQSILSKYELKFHEYRKILNELQSLKNKDKQSVRELEFLKFQLTELEQADLDNIDFESLENEYKSLNDAEEIQKVLSKFSNVVSLSEINISEQLDDLSKELVSLARVHQSIADIKETLDDVNDDLHSLMRRCEDLSEEIEYDEEKIQELKDRLDLIYSLQKKHDVNEISELIDQRENILLRIQNNDNLDEHIAFLESSLGVAKERLTALSDDITESRKSVSATFSGEIEALLQKLSMPNARFHVNITPAHEFDMHGRDVVEFQFSANKGIPLNPLNKIASGGELSRVALCIKSILADKTNLPTMIFDEVDSGVSGQVAMIMGQLIADLSKKYQIITITHSPQVAAQGDNHFLIYKLDRKERSFTMVKQLSDEERIMEIAQMLGGQSPSEAAVMNARELLGLQFT